MRPLELTLKGFQSYADQHVFDFRDRHLLGIVGPIGAGKSSLLDGIAFALYGRTPRAGKTTKDLINHHSSAAQVELWFEVDAEIWRAVRAVRRKGQSAHNLYRHEDDDADSDVLEHVEQERPMTSRVEELLGLPFDGFNRSVFLAQNRFAEFLHATDSQRDAVLKGVFGLDRLDRMAELAKRRRDELRLELGDLERLRAEVEVDREALAVARPELATAGVRVAELESLRKQSELLAAAEAAALSDEERANRRLAELTDLAAQLPAKEQSSQLLDRAATTANRLTEAESGVRSAEEALRAARRHLQEVRTASGGAAALERAAGLLERLESLSRQIGEAQGADAAAADGLARAVVEAETAAVNIEAAEAAVATAEETEKEALARMGESERALHDARHSAMALTLRRELTAGAACPVCEQAVATLPSAGDTPAVEKAEKALENARGGLRAAQGARTDAVSAGAEARARHHATVRASEVAEEAARAASEFRSRLEDEQRQLMAELRRLVDADDPAGELDRRRRGLAEAEALVERSTAKETEGRAAREAVRADAAHLEGELVQLATTVATLAGQLGGAIRPAADVAELTDGLDQLRKLWEERATAAKESVEEVAARRAEAQKGLALLVENLDLEPGESLATAHQRAIKVHARLEERVQSLEGRVGRFEELRAASSETANRLDIFTILADDLLPSRFLKFILDEERRALGRLGSEHFERMSRGRYRFTEDGGFNVMDLSAAEAERKSGTLSGGETFLASLSLALALAEMVARSGGRLDAFFLDEGFGSLDPEHLDLAMEGIEALVGGDRLVVVVSHVPELRERVEDLIQLDRDGVTGATVVVRP